jgi:hypothetical protein
LTFLMCHERWIRLSGNEIGNVAAATP